MVHGNLQHGAQCTAGMPAGPATLWEALEHGGAQHRHLSRVLMLKVQRYLSQRRVSIGHQLGEYKHWNFLRVEHFWLRKTVTSFLRVSVFLAIKIDEGILFHRIVIGLSEIAFIKCVKQLLVNWVNSCNSSTLEVEARGSFWVWNQPELVSLVSLKYIARLCLPTNKQHM